MSSFDDSDDDEPIVEFDNISYEKSDDGIALIMIDRPEKLNALNLSTINELTRAFLDAKTDDAVRAVILTGGGGKAFVAGADIAEMAALGPEAAKSFAQCGQKLTLLIENLGKPVIAAVNGFALGGGCELAMACTFRLASDRAKFGQPEVKLGLIPGFGGSQRLARLVGRGRALQLLLTGEMISSAEAYRIGLVNEITSDDELLSTAEELADKMKRNAPLALKYCIEATNIGVEMPMEEALFLEATLFGLCFATEDMREGTQAFLEKRQPDFKGK
ncbi:MAG TPA: enoyl-CoA hydratase-related protein [Blastocatellia bacterium]|nr:enoyl-CoA hydratase-related protein [Blastocatellia bacterium]